VSALPVSFLLCCFLSNIWQLTFVFAVIPTLNIIVVFLVVQTIAPLAHPEMDLVSSLQAVVEKIIQSGGPVCTTGGIPSTAGVFAKLTDESLYTGKHRKDEYSGTASRSASASVAGKR
jgi:hypothetical protein